MKIPMLIISDAPSASSGLGRICRDLATRIHTNLGDLFEVATLGYGGIGDSSLPFMQYHIEGMDNWYIPTLMDVWNNFAGKRRGVVFTIWDASRMLWFSRPDEEAFVPDPDMRKWLRNAPFERWGYFPMDAAGPSDALSMMLYQTMVGYDRIIAYSDWAEKIIRNTMSEADCEKRNLVAIPHGIDTSVFRPRNIGRSIFRSELHYNGRTFEDYEKLIGIVATNQTRKDYGLAIEALAIASNNCAFRFFINVDALERHWSIPALVVDFNLKHRAIVNMNPVEDWALAEVYSACDLTLGIGPEGFGYPIFESLACGTPVIAGQVGGHAEHMPAEFLMKPIATRIETVYNCVRPVYDPKQWAYHIEKALKRNKTKESLLPARLDWNNLWANEWEPYFKAQHRRIAHPVPTLIQPSNMNETDTASMVPDTPKVSSPGGYLAP